MNRLIGKKIKEFRFSSLLHLKSEELLNNCYGFCGSCGYKSKAYNLTTYCPECGGGDLIFCFGYENWFDEEFCINCKYKFICLTE